MNVHPVINKIYEHVWIEYILDSLYIININSTKICKTIPRVKIGYYQTEPKEGYFNRNNYLNLILF